LSWTRQPAAGLVVTVGDFEGTNDTFSWSPELLTQTGSTPALESCLDRLRMAVRLGDSGGGAQPHFISSAAIQCFESSGMPAYATAHQPNASDYDVELATGNINKSIAPPPGVPLFATGGPYLGAHRHIRTSLADPATVAKDVQECRDKATADGVLTTSRMSADTQTTGYVTIGPMIERFDRCLRDRGYSVESTKP
jgi:hypothetical protein